MKSTYGPFITKTLKKKGIMLSTELASCLQEKFKLSKAYSKTVISRLIASKIVFTSYPLKFKDGCVGCSLENNNHWQYAKLLEKNKPKLNAAYSYLRNNYGISHYDLLKLTGAINLFNTKYYDIGKVLSDLKYLFSELEETTIDNIKFYTISQRFDYNNEYNNQIVNATIAPYVLYYCKKIGLIYPKPKYISRSNPFAGIQTRQNLLFDAISFTSIGSYQAEKTLCVFDISVNDYNEDKFNGFKCRVETLINSTKHTKEKRQRIIPVIVVSDVEYPLEQKILGFNKFILLKLTNIFGSRIKQLLKIINLSQLRQIRNVSEVFSIIDTSERAKEFTNFMPIVFEVLVNEMINLYLKGEYTTRTHSERKILKDGSKKEFDGWFENKNEILVIESKCYRKSKVKWVSFNSKGEKENDCVSYFLEDKLVFLKKWCIENSVQKQIKMCFVSANALDNSVNDHLKDVSANHKHRELPLAMTIKDFVALLNAKSISFKEYKKWLDNYYLRKDEKIDDYEFKN